MNVSFVESNDPYPICKLVTWDQFNFQTGNNDPVKSITLSLEAGDVVKIRIERYVDTNNPVDFKQYQTITSNGGPTIGVSEYVLCDSTVNATFIVKNVSNNKLISPPSMEEKFKNLILKKEVLTDVLKTIEPLIEHEVKKEMNKETIMGFNQ